MVRLLAAVAALLAGAALLTWLIDGYLASEGVLLGVHGLIATYLCLVFVPGTAIGLMLLVRLSRDRGYDERASGSTGDGEDADQGP